MYFFIIAVVPVVTDFRLIDLEPEILNLNDEMYRLYETKILYYT
jgi:hypothetical protein